MTRVHRIFTDTMQFFLIFCGFHFIYFQSRRFNGRETRWITAINQRKSFRATKNTITKNYKAGVCVSYSESISNWYKMKRRMTLPVKFKEIDEKWSLLDFVQSPEYFCTKLVQIRKKNCCKIRRKKTKFPVIFHDLLKMFVL